LANFWFGWSGGASDFYMGAQGCDNKYGDGDASDEGGAHDEQFNQTKESTGCNSQQPADQKDC
jgi:hypothetical protein